jgi:hypothetical protein
MNLSENAELELLLNLDGASYEAAAGYVVEFSARRVPVTKQRPHGIVYSLVLRPKSGGERYVRFDNAHGVPHRGGRHMRRKRRTTTGTGRRTTTLAGPTPSPPQASSSRISGAK